MSKTTTKRPQNKPGGGFDLPPGYMAKGYGRRLSDPDEPCFWQLYRHDEEKRRFVIVEDSLGRQDVEPSARRDHLRRTLRTIDGGRWALSMPEGYSQLERHGCLIVVRPDDSEVRDFSIYATTDRLTHAAWADHRRRTLHLVKRARLTEES